MSVWGCAEAGGRIGADFHSDGRRAGFRAVPYRRPYTSEAVVYFQAEDGETLRQAQEKIRNYMAEHYPHGTVEFGVSGNIFDLIFSNDDADLEIRLQRQGGGRPDVQEARAFWTLCRAVFPEVAVQPVVSNATYNTWPTRSRWRCTMCRMPLYRLG